MSFRAVVPVVLFPFLLLLAALESVVFAGEPPKADPGADLFPWNPVLQQVTGLSDDGESNGVPDDQRAAWIVDNFEDGNITEWIDVGGGACTASTSAIAAAGAYSMRIDGACGHYLGRMLDITGSKPTGISVWVRSNTVDTHDTYLIFGDADTGTGNTGAIYFHGSVNGTWTVFNFAGGHSCGPRVADQWYKLDFNIDWACKMFDVSVDGVLRQSNVDFYHAGTESFDQIHVYNWSSGTTGRYDEIYFYTPGVSPLIFEDDFERTSACRWSVVVQ